MPDEDATDNQTDDDPKKGLPLKNETKALTDAEISRELHEDDSNQRGENDD